MGGRRNRKGNQRNKDFTTESENEFMRKFQDSIIKINRLNNNSSITLDLDNDRGRDLDELHRRLDLNIAKRERGIEEKGE